MRGSPLLRALLAFFCILALGFPLWKLTGENASQRAPDSIPAPASKKVPVRMQLSFTTPPKSVRVLHLGEEIFSVQMPAQELEKDLTLEFPKEGVDLQFEVEWPNDALCAMKVVLNDPEGTPHEKSLWGRGSVSDVLTFQ